MKSNNHVGLILICLISMLIFPVYASSPTLILEHKGSGILAEDGDVIFAYTENKIFFLDKNGSKFIEHLFKNLSRFSLSKDGNYVIAVSSEDGDPCKTLFKANISMISLKKGLLWSKELRVRDVEISPQANYVAVLSVKDIPYYSEYVGRINLTGNILYLFNISGDLLWSFDSNSSVEWFSKNSGVLKISKNGDIIFGIPPAPFSKNRTFGKIFLLNKNGRLLWIKEVKGEPLQVKISENGDKVIVITIYGILYCFDENGNLKWSMKIFKGGMMEAYLYISSNAELILIVGPEYMVAVDGDGNILMREKYSPKTGLPIRGTVSSNGNYILIYFPYKEELVLYSKHGEEIWEMRMNKFFVKRISISNEGDYIVVSNSGSFKVFNNTLAKFEVPKEVKRENTESKTTTNYSKIWIFLLIMIFVIPIILKEIRK